MPPRLRPLLLAWPWAVVLGVAAWISAPLWQSQELFFGALTGDNMQTAWFYDWVSRAIRSGEGLSLLSDFNYPNPKAREVGFPAVADAVIAAPLAWWMDFPQQFGAAQGLAVIINALGFAWLARALGCRGLGIAFAGCLGAFCHPAWKAIHMARMNAAWPGLAAAALGAWMEILRPGPEGSWKAILLRRAPWVPVAAVLGAIAAATYPPFLLMLAPAGLLLLAGRVRTVRWQALVLAGLAVALGLALAWPELAVIASSSRVSAADMTREACLSARCPDPTLTVPLSRWFLVEPPGRGEQMLSGMTLGSWILAGLALLAKGRRLLVVGWLAVGTCLALISLGPCPEWAAGVSSSVADLPLLSALLPFLWCETTTVHDYGRFAAAAAAMAAALGGLGLEALGQRWRRLGWVLALALGIGAATQAGQTTLGHLSMPLRWNRVPDVPAAEAIANLGEGAIAELPYDQSWQYLSVLEVPARPRANPLRERAANQTRDPFLSWLRILGTTGRSDSLPTATQAEASGLSWVLFDRGRCRPPRPPPAACGSQVASALTEVLGAPQLTEGAVQIWAVKSATPQ